ncbi:MAG: S1 RNA-binding domain-containing protein [Phycisphaerales bacterium]|nr:S1 RNA-binding domain-containing protein [Phycisphaerales bacterium]
MNQPPDPASGETPLPQAPSTVSSSLESEIEAMLGGLTAGDLMGSAPSSPKRPTGVRPVDGGRKLRLGKIVRVTKEDIFVEFGPKSHGVCPASQFKEPPAEGEQIEFQVERLDPFENLLILCRPGVVTKAEWGSLAIGQVVDARCTGMNRGGLDMEVAHHKAFMPAAHADVRHLEDLSVLLGQKIACEIIELKRNSERMVLSRRKVLERERSQNRQQILDGLAPGQTKTVTIVSIQSFGAFADLGGIDGLIPIGELSYERVKEVGDVVKVGDVIDVKVMRVDRSAAQPKISLSRKNCLSDPAVAAFEQLVSGATVSGRVTRLTEFGAFVELSPGVEGLVHVSEITHDRLPNPVASLKRDQIVEVKVLSIDPERKRIGLSLKALKVAEPHQQSGGGDGRPGGGRGGDGRPGGGRGGKDFLREELNVVRADDPEMRKLRARFGQGASSLKGGLNTFPVRRAD